MFVLKHEIKTHGAIKDQLLLKGEYKYDFQTASDKQITWATISRKSVLELWNIFVWTIYRHCSRMYEGKDFVCVSIGSRQRLGPGLSAAAACCHNLIAVQNISLGGD